MLITHDLALVSQNCDRVGVMHAGHIVEVGTVAQIFESPAAPVHEGTAQLGAELEGDAGEALALEGRAPRLSELPPHGCRFAARCVHRMPKCEEPFAHGRARARSPRPLPSL